MGGGGGGNRIGISRTYGPTSCVPRKETNLRLAKMKHFEQRLKSGTTLINFCDLCRLGLFLRLTPPFPPAVLEPDRSKNL